MICPECRGRGWLSAGSPDDELTVIEPCPTCGGGGIAYCCEGEGPPAPVFQCARCGAIQESNVILCEACRAPLVFRL